MVSIQCEVFLFPWDPSRCSQLKFQEQIVKKKFMATKKFDNNILIVMKLS